MRRAEAVAGMRAAVEAGSVEADVVIVTVYESTSGATLRGSPARRLNSRT
jgi:succinate dehydrogenase/fumarate reductase flavoprotein subunit